MLVIIFMPKKKKKKGFTLIELLVVIAIIGILSTIVLVSVNSARNKAKDATIKGSMETLRAAAELNYDTEGDYDDVCTSGNLLSSGGDFGRVKTAVELQSGVPVYCADATSPAQSYAAYARLVADAGKFFCVDSSGNAKVELATAASLCP